MIIVWENNNSKPREVKEYFNILVDGMYASKFESSKHPFYHGQKIEDPELLKKELIELEKLFY